MVGEGKPSAASSLRAQSSETSSGPGTLSQPDTATHTTSIELNTHNFICNPLVFGDVLIITHPLNDDIIYPIRRNHCDAVHSHFVRRGRGTDGGNAWTNDADFERPYRP